MSVDLWIRLLLGGVFLLSNAFFVTSEFALTRLRQLSREEVGESRALRRAWGMTERLEIYLSGCQVGITISSIGLGVAAEPALTELLRPMAAFAGLAEGPTRTVAFVTAFVLINMAHVIIGEQAPTYLGVERTREVARWCAGPLRAWTRLMSPVIRVADFAVKRLLGLVGVEITRSWTREDEEDPVASRGELRRAMGELLARGEIARDRRQEVLAALDIGEIPVREIMVDREEIVALEARASWEETLRVLRTHAYVRFPVWSDDVGAFTGIVYAPSLFRELDALRRGESTPGDIAAPLLEIDAGTPVSRVIDTFQAHGQELALVVTADDARVVGLITSTDAMEAITGQLRDPFDARE